MSGTTRKSRLRDRVIQVEVCFFSLFIVLIWLNELLDIPHHLFHAAATPVNWRESVVETLIALLLCLFLVRVTARLVSRIRYLEGFLLICSCCQRVKVGDKWTPLAEYIQEHSQAEFSHGLCPDCAAAYYSRELP